MLSKVTEQSSYNFSVSLIQQRASAISKVCKELDIELFFALKCCSDSKFIEFILPFVDGFDVSNLNELNLISRFNKKISFFSPVLTTEILEKIDHTGFSVSVEDSSFKITNAQKYYRFDFTSLFSKKTQSRFGIESVELSKCTDVEAVHIHVREIDEYESLDFIKVIKNLLLEHPNLKAINLGGGWHKIVGKENYVVFLSNIRKAFPSIKLRIEPGRFFSLNSGTLKSKVMKIDFKRRRIVVDISSMLHLLWCTPSLDTSDSTNRVDIIVYGSTCFEHDLVGSFSVDADWFTSLNVGDEVLFSGLSTYTLQRQCAFNGIEKLSVNWLFNN